MDDCVKFFSSLIYFFIWRWMFLMEDDDDIIRWSPRYASSTKRHECIKSIDVKVMVEVYDMGQERGSVYRIPDASTSKFYQTRLKDLNPKQVTCYYFSFASPTYP
jgi:hypothetical protein